MGNLAITYQYIADILSFKTKDYYLEKTLNNPLFNWDAIVVEGSKHLVLPTIYCRLKAKKLLYVLPEELNTYLEEITKINRNRNESIIQQVYTISKLLNKHEIDHVFMKGSALLFSETYDDIAERMIGDIDILISRDQLDLAFNLLTDNDYYPVKETFGYDFFEYKHLPRLKTKEHICAVELHRKLFHSYKDNVLTNDNILKTKRLVQGVFIPSENHLFRHNLLNYQINDSGNFYNGISFRPAYDTISLLRYNINFDLDTYKKKVFKNYLNLIGLFFKDVNKVITVKNNFKTSFYLFKLNNIKFYKFWNKLLNLTSFTVIILKRIPYLLINEKYRKALFKDRRRVYKYFISVLKNS